MKPKAIAVKVEQAGERLVESLSREDASFLEHLEMRGGLLRLLAGIDASSLPPEIAASLQRASEQGHQAKELLLKEQARIRREFLGASRRRTAENQYAGLDRNV